MLIKMKSLSALPTDVLKMIYKKSVRVIHEDNLKKGGTLGMRREIYARTAEDLLTGQFGVPTSDVIACVHKALEIIGECTRVDVQETHERRTYTRGDRDYTVLISSGETNISVIVYDSEGQFSMDYYTFAGVGDRMFQMIFTPSGPEGGRFDISGILTELGFMKTPSYRGRWTIKKKHAQIAPLSRRHTIYQSIR